MQASFGPTLTTIYSFPNVDSNNFIDENYTNFEVWIDQQIAKHRSIIVRIGVSVVTQILDYSTQSGYLENEVGHNSSYAPIPFVRGKLTI